jgi:uridine kinase
MLIIGIAGGSGSGKTTVVKKIIEGLPEGSVSLIAQDAYYYDNGYLSDSEKKKINFDHPSSIEFDLLTDHIKKLKNGSSIEMPVYSYVSCARSNETITVEPLPVVIVEGILIHYYEKLREHFNIKVYVDADPDDRLIRIIKRDTRKRGRDLQMVIEHYEDFVKPMHEQFIEPTKRYADIIIPMGGSNLVAIDILTSKIRTFSGNSAFS